MGRVLTTGKLYPITTGLQFLLQKIPVVTLDLNHAFLGCAAASASFFQRSGQFLERRIRKGDSGYDYDRATATPLDLAAQAYRTVGWWFIRLCRARFGFFLFYTP